MDSPSSTESHDQASRLEHGVQVATVPPDLDEKPALGSPSTFAGTFSTFSPSMNPEARCGCVQSPLIQYCRFEESQDMGIKRWQRHAASTLSQQACHHCSESCVFHLSMKPLTVVALRTSSPSLSPPTDQRPSHLQSNPTHRAILSSDATWT